MKTGSVGLRIVVLLVSFLHAVRGDVHLYLEKGLGVVRKEPVALPQQLQQQPLDSFPQQQQQQQQPTEPHPITDSSVDRNYNVAGNSTHPLSVVDNIYGDTVGPSNSWKAVWLLTAMIICAISPILFKEGALPFMTVVTYLACLSLVKMYVKATMSSGYPYPDTITMVHMLGTALFAGIIERPVLAEAWNVLPISAVNGVSLILNNTALVHGGVAFISMISCTTPIFTFSLETVRCKRQLDTAGIFSVMLVCFGAMFCVKGERISSMASFMLAVVATFFRATKSVWQHELLTVSLSPMRMVFWSGFWSFLLMVPVAAASEGFSGVSHFFTTTSSARVNFLMSTLCACVLNVSQCLAVKQLGALMQSIIGNLNLILVIVLSQAWLHEDIDPWQYYGVTLLVSGTVLSKMTDKRGGTKGKGESEQPLAAEDSAAKPGGPCEKKTYGH
mmetsp:Transcript_42362/g.76021  ORF Transcript_42362/g.76021 Transcript_42362/m.76021 type:complete len:445 (+) Transcript_42362:76-1410(+)|eukprot:CAMPEP_0197630366 /NCGR_PEP_ID=MMETSP1338-20131121/7875_1 /TAXON_ID=43686 ORGANISM="Pelagodinium beii, Strain RCC1491" /NCGR_SAMPLE_ID=MMETSP1338 /ASSEMBLY_ACC=CAM_ASM_000754 /LENGTH=444 /DNA_ID=CAMNT_0043201571 /DNA_START=76 /DNA_END=1410 /DNA_ORIENTATION=-